MSFLKTFIFVIIIIAVIATSIALSDFSYWFQPPAKKFAIATRADFKLLQKTNYLPPAFSKIKNLNISSDASHVQDWLQADAFDIPQKKDGEYTLDIFVSEWIDGYRYGALLQYDLVEIKTKNTVWELNRTYKLGFIY